MAYRFVFSQMFDVRPRTSAGELDLEKIAKIERFLNLRVGQSAPLSERIINLRIELQELAAEAEEDERQETPSFGDIPTNNQIHNEPEFLEANPPDISEILSIFETIEAADRLLKKPPLKEGEAAKIFVDTEKEIPKALEIPVKNIIAAPGVEAETEEEAEAEIIEEAPEDIVEAPEFGTDEELSIGRIAQENLPIIEENSYEEKQLDFIPALPESPAKESFAEAFWLKPQPAQKTDFAAADYFQTPEFSLAKRLPKARFNWHKNKKPLALFLATALLMFSFVPLLGWVNKALEAKTGAFNSGLAAYDALMDAKVSLTDADFKKAEKNFVDAEKYFASADSQINQAGGFLLKILEKIPGFSYISSRTHLVLAGQDMSKAGEQLSEMISLFENKEIGLGKNNGNGSPLSSLVFEARNYLEAGLASLVSARQNLAEVKISSLPQEMQGPVTMLAEKLPTVTEGAVAALDWSDKFLSILGHQSAKKYLLIFQNNAEIRPTGGFIGTYGVVDLDQGEIENLFVDGIFNADGQLQEKIIPPRPIQKISTAWSMHDSNWFADFPTSAQKLMWFYEKTGGPTVDGVISFTPTLIERLLNLIGPIEMPEYGVTLNADNFFEITEYKVEADYDKTLNQPKKILADFTPKFIEKLSTEIGANNMEILRIINEAFKEKHILVYFSDPELEQFAVSQGWAGEILGADKDYFSVVNTNINGFKTDRVMEQKIKYWSEIQEDGSIVDTLEITRHHQGGDAQFEWFNKVNADYLRVYLPPGSQLISVSGQTKEEYKPPIDYQASGFKTDSDVADEIASMQKDTSSGTDIFEETGKTVFGNWVYTSPGETTVLTYKYRLPFRLDLSAKNASFSLLAQKQSGSTASNFEAKIILPSGWKVDSSLTEGSGGGNIFSVNSQLAEDRLIELSLSKH